MKNNGLNTKKSRKRVTLEELQGMFLDIAQNYADESLDFMRKDSSGYYAERPEAFKEDFLGLLTTARRLFIFDSEQMCR